MTFFNFVNARKLDDQFNVLSGLGNSSYFLPILGIILVLQIIIVTFGGIAFRCSPWGLGIVPWIICVGFGLGALLWRVVVLPFPEEKLCPAVSSKLLLNNFLTLISSEPLKSLKKKEESSAH